MGSEYALYWAVLIAVCVVIELITLGLTSIWFAGGALVAAIAALLGADLIVQIVLFFVVSTVLLVFTRPWAQRFLDNRTVKTNAESLVGKTGKVIEKINNYNTTGQVKIGGLVWTARSLNDQVNIDVDTKVVIREIRGVKLMVEPVKEN